VWDAVRAPGVPPPGVPRFVAGVVGGTLGLAGVLLALGAIQHGRAARHFSEGEVGTYASAALLIAAAAVAMRTSRRLAGHPWAKSWLVAGAGFLFLAADELTLIHEGADKWIHARLGWPDDHPVTDHLDDAIIVLYGVAAAVWAFRSRERLLRLRWATCLLSAAVAVFVIMLVVDVSDASKAVEESLKLVTEALIVAGLFAALRDPALADPTEPGVYFRGL
jgi:hypothetical protein